MSTMLAHVPSPAVHNLFFAIKPPEEKVREIMDLIAALDLGGAPLRPDRLHISLLALVCRDDVPEGLIEEARDVAGDIRMNPMRVIFDRAVGGQNSAFLQPSEPLDVLRMFRERLGLALRSAGVDLHLGGRFSPHITLLYGGQPKPETPIDAITWVVEEFVLIDSLIGETKHVEVGRWPLRS